MDIIAQLLPQLSSMSKKRKRSLVEENRQRALDIVKGIEPLRPASLKSYSGKFVEWKNWCAKFQGGDEIGKLTCPL